MTKRVVVDSGIGLLDFLQRQLTEQEFSLPSKAATKPDATAAPAEPAVTARASSEAAQPAPENKIVNKPAAVKRANSAVDFRSSKIEVPLTGKKAVDV